MRWSAPRVGMLFGMRGTCSDASCSTPRRRANRFSPNLTSASPRRMMMPATHLLWAACWTGVAAGAVERAQTFVRKIARAGKGAPPPGAPLATQAYLSLMTLINLVDAALADFERRTNLPDALEDLTFQTSLNLLKVSASPSCRLRRGHARLQRLRHRGLPQR